MTLLLRQWLFGHNKHDQVVLRMLWVITLTKN